MELSVPDPARQVGSIDDAEDEHDPIVIEDVVHDPQVAHAQAMEAIPCSADRLRGLPADPTWRHHLMCESPERLTDAPALLVSESLELLDG